jgi:hypothetical protein
MEKKITPEHDEVIHTTYVEHYEAHEKREETPLFKKTKKDMHNDGVKCWIDNGRCEGTVEIHHNIIEWSAATEIDWEIVRQIYPWFKDVDQREQMLGLCAKHHRHKGYGIHLVPYPIWVLQKFMNEEALDDFERAVQEKLYGGVK